jgi:tRNA splicing ligase
MKSTVFKATEEWHEKIAEAISEINTRQTEKKLSKTKFITVAVQHFVESNSYKKVYNLEGGKNAGH